MSTLCENCFKGQFAIIQIACPYTKIVTTTYSQISFAVRPNIDYDKKYKATLILKAGSSFNIPVTVTGFPTPKVIWSYNNKSLDPSDTVKTVTKGSDSSVTVKPCSRKDSGMYQVSAENEVGTANAEFEVIVKDKPTPPRDLQVGEIQRVSISVSWEAPEGDGGAPITAYILEKKDAKKTSWTSAGKAKPDLLTSTITKLIEGNEYYIRVSAENEIGVSEPVQTKDPVKAKSPYGE